MGGNAVDGRAVNREPEREPKRESEREPKRELKREPLRLCRSVLGRTIWVWALPLDQGLHVLVVGGDRSHVGAVSGAGYPAGRARDERADRSAGNSGEKAGARPSPETLPPSKTRPSSECLPSSETLPPQTLSFGTHKEGAITEVWAAALAARLSMPCTVACGIHYDGLSREGIGQVMDACRELLEELAGRLTAPGQSPGESR